MSRTMSDPLPDLISKLALATEGNRELDWDVAAGIGWKTFWSGYHFYLPPGEIEEGHGQTVNLPQFSTSIDAALTLVPDGWSFRLERDASDWWMELWSRDTCHPRCRFSGGDYVKRTGALIMCLEALRARLALMEIVE